MWATVGQAPSEGWTIANTIATVAAVISALAFAVSFASRRTARESLRIAKEQEARRQQGLRIYLHDAQREPHSDAWLVGVHVRVDNPADRPASVVSADFVVDYVRDGAEVQSKIPSTPDAPIFLEDEVILSVPVKIEQNHAVSGWFAFRVPRDLTEGARVNGRQLAIEDVHGRVETVDVTGLGRTS